MQSRMQLRAIEALQDGITDYDNTISQFRDLVTNLQLYVPFLSLPFILHRVEIPPHTDVDVDDPKGN